jgi:hypothetical protein
MALSPIAIAILAVLIVATSVVYYLISNTSTPINVTSTSITVNATTISTVATTTILTAMQSAHFNSSDWKVSLSSPDAQGTRYAILTFNYTATAPVMVYLFDNVTAPYGGLINSYSTDNYSWEESTNQWPAYDNVSFNKGSGTSSLRFISDSVPGNYLMVAYSIGNHTTFSGVSIIPIWNRTFTFSGPQMAITNVSISWNLTGASGVYWYQPTLVVAYIKNTGDMPGYGYNLRTWVNGTPLFMMDGPSYSWIPVGGPYQFNFTSPYAIIEDPGNYSVHAEWVKESYNKLAAQWNGYTRIS